MKTLDHVLVMGGNGYWAKEAIQDHLDIPAAVKAARRKAMSPKEYFVYQCTGDTFVNRYGSMNSPQDGVPVLLQRKLSREAEKRYVADETRR